MSFKVDKAKEIASDFRNFFRLKHYLQEDHIKNAIQFLEADLANHEIGGGNYTQNNSRESSKVFIEIVDIFLPAYMEILEQSPMQYEYNQVQRTRLSILELLNKFFVVRNQQTNVRLYSLLLDIVRRDNETNANCATKILHEFIKQLTEQINNQHTGILQKMNDFGVESLQNAYATLIQFQQQQQDEKVQQLQQEGNGMQIEENNQDQQASVNGKQNQSNRPMIDHKIEDFLNFLIDIEENYPKLEQLTDDVYKVLCDKSKLIQELSQNYKDPQFNVYKEQSVPSSSSSSKKNPRQQQQSQAQSQVNQQQQSSQIQQSQQQNQTDKIIPSPLSLQILSQLPHTFITIANLDLQPFCKICMKFQAIKQNALQEKDENNQNNNNINSSAASAIIEESNQANSNNNASQQSNQQKNYNFENFNNQLVKQTKEMINNIIKGFADLKIQEIYEEMGKNITQELIVVLTKMIKFFSVLIKRNEDISQRAIFKNMNKQVLEQILDTEKVIECAINLVDKCPEELYQQRIETIQNLRSLIFHKQDKHKLKYWQQLYQEQKIVGSVQLISIYGKNQLQNHLLELYKNLNQEFSRYYISQIQQQSVRINDIMVMQQIIFNQIETLIKNIFDNQLYILMQERSLELLKDVLRNFITFSSNSKVPNEIKVFRHSILMKVVHAIQMKYKEIKRNFQSIKRYVSQQEASQGNNQQSQNKKNEGKKDDEVNDQQMQIEEPQFQKNERDNQFSQRDDNKEKRVTQLHLNQMPIANLGDYDEIEWKKKRIDFIKNNNVNIESNLQSLQHLQFYYLEIYNQKETLFFNGIKIKKNIDRQFIRDIKNKIVDYLIELQRDIQNVFFNENREEEFINFTQKYKNANPKQIEQRKVQLSMYNTLKKEQRSIFRKILKNGLEVFEFFHDYEHTNNRSAADNSQQSRKIHLLYFMQNFGMINDKISFKDIFEPNMDTIFKYLLKYSDCSENCMKNLIIEPFVIDKQKMQMPIQNNQTIENSHLAQILIIYLMHKLNTNIENIDPFSPFYEYKDKYFTRIQSIIKIPLRSFIRLSDYEFVISYFRQIIIFLIKKSHTSQYPLEYLQILRTLFKCFLSPNVENQQLVNNLMNQFFSICNKSDDNSSNSSSSSQQQPSSSSSSSSQSSLAQQDTQYQNINIIENLIALFDTDIHEVKVIVCELILLLPLKVRHIVAKTKIIGRPLVKALSLFDQANTVRSLKTIESILGYCTHEEVQHFFMENKDELMEKLYQIIYEQRIIEEVRKKPHLYPDTHSIDKKIQNDPAIIAVKLLGRMNHLTRSTKFQEKLQNDIKNQEYLDQFYINIEMNNPQKDTLNLPLNDVILHSIDIFNKIIDNFYCQTVRGNSTLSAFCILKIALFQFFPDSLFKNSFASSSQVADNFFQNEMENVFEEKELPTKKLFQILHQENQNDEKIQEDEGILDKILKIFFEIVGIDQKLTTSFSIINRFKKESQKILEILNKTICILYKTNKDEAFKYLKAITLNGIRSVKMKVILTREELHLCKDQICGQIEFIQKFFKNQQEYLKDANRNSYVEFQDFYLKSILKELLNTTNQNKIYGLQVILLDFIEEYIHDQTLLQNQQQNVIEIINTIFIILNEIPDIINLKTTKVSSQILSKTLKFFRKHKDSFERLACKKLIAIFFNNLLTYREFAHTLAKDCLVNASQIHKKNLIDLFYWRMDTSDFEDSPFITGNNMLDSPHLSSQSSNINNSQSSYAYNVTQHPISKIIEKMQNTFLGSLLMKIKTSIQNFSLTNNNFENIKQMKYISNVYKTLEFLICTDQNRLPFRVLINDPPQQIPTEEQNTIFNEKYYKFDPDIVSIIQSSDIIIATNTEKMSKHVKIIIENTKPANQPSSASQNGAKPGEVPAASNAPRPSNAPTNGNPSIPPNPAPGSSQPPAAGASTQRAGNNAPVQNTFQINHQVYLNIEEFDLNIEDIDLRMKEQSNLIQSILSFLKSLLLLNPVKKVAKSNLKNREKNQQDQSEILSYRYKIILKLFGQMTRIERGISSTSQSCLHEMINQDSHPKELLNNEDKLKSILKPVLMCLSNHFHTFTPSFLQVLKKILKLLTPCFNKALSDKLTTHLDDVTKDPNQKYNIQCISGLLKLFQYLQYAYQTAYNNNNQASKQKEYIKKSIDTIIQNINKIEQYYSQTEGKYQIQQITRKSLCKFMNSMSAQVTENYFTETDPEILNLLLEILKLNKAMVVRERLTRDSNQSVIQKLYNKGREKENKIVFLRIIKNLGYKNCRLMLNNQQGVECIKERLTETIKIYRDKTITDSSMIQIQQMSTKNEIIYYLKILVIYCQQKHTDIETLFNLADFLSIRMARYTYFVQDFFNYYLPYHYSVEHKKAIYEKFLEFILQNMEKKEKVETIINISYHIIYPMLVHSNKLGQVPQIVDKKKQIEFFDKQFKIPKLMFPYYRLEMEILQLSTLLLSYLRQDVIQYKKEFIRFGWKYMKCEEKLLKHISYVYTCQFITLFGMPEEMIFSIYASLINRKQDDIVVQQENEIGSLIKKALNFLIPFLAQNNSQNKYNDWVKWTTNIFSDDSNQKHAILIRFWQIFIKNHQIFQQYRKQFSPHMINSTQQLIIQATRQTSSQNSQNKIAWDLTFLYIEWSFIEMKSILNNAQVYAKQQKLKQLVEKIHLNQAQQQQNEGSQTPKFQIEEESINEKEFVKKITSSQLVQSQNIIQDQLSENKGEPVSFSRSMQQVSEQPNYNSGNSEQDFLNNKQNFDSQQQIDSILQQQKEIMLKYNISEEDLALTAEEILNAEVELVERFSEEIDQGAKGVIIPFYIKLITNILSTSDRDRDEKNFIKRTLYLLKKTFFIWPDIQQRNEYYKTQLQKFSNRSYSFYYCQLNILSIILEFESNEKILNFLPTVYKLLDNKPSQPAQAANGPTPQGNQPETAQPQPTSSNQNQNSTQFNLLQIDNPYTILILSTIFKRLLNTANIYKENEQAAEFFRNVQQLVKESIEQHVKYLHLINQYRMPNQPIPPPVQTQLNQMKSQQPMSIQLSIKLLKVLYQLDDKADLGLRNIKTLVQFMLEKVKSCKSPIDGYYLLTNYSEYDNNTANKILKTPIKQTQNQSIIQEFSEEYEETMLYYDEVYDYTKISSIHNKQNFVTLLRILALKINSFNDKDNQDITSILKMLASYLEKIYDLDIRIEAVNLLKCLMIGEKAFKNNTLPPQYSKIKQVNLSAEKKMELIIGIFNYIARIFDKRFGLTNLQLKLTNTYPDSAAEFMSLKVAEEYISQEFMSFLVHSIKESGINKLDSDFVRYLLLLFVKNSSSFDLALFFQLAGDLFCTSDFNCLQMILGQFQSEKCLKKILSVVINQMSKEYSLENLEQDEVLLLAFKVILFKIVDYAPKVRIKFQSDNFEANQLSDDSKNDNLSLELKQQFKEFFDLKDYSLNKREIIELYSEMMASAQIKQSPINSIDTNTNSYIFVLYQPLVSFSCPITPHLLIPAFKKVFNFMVQLNPKPIQLRQQAIQLFEQSILRLNPFPPVFNNQKQYISLYFVQALTEIIMEELENPTGYIIQPEKLQTTCREYNIWSNVQIYLEKMHFQRDKYITQFKQYSLNNFETSSVLDQLSQIIDETNESDYSYGLKFYMSNNANLKRAIAIQQQREWNDAQNFLIEKRAHIFNDNQAKFSKDNASYYSILEDYSHLMDQSIYKSLFIETQKNLNKWEDLYEYSEKTQNIYLQLECMYNTSNITGMKKEIGRCIEYGLSMEIPFRYYCSTLIDFQKTTDREDSKQDQGHNLTYAYYLTLKDWTKFPKIFSSVHLKHSLQLQQLIELEEGFRVRDIRDQQINHHPAHMIESLSKGTQMMFNQWRERMPHKYENLITWKNVIDQRNFILNSINVRLKDRFKGLLQKLLQINQQRRNNLANQNQTSENSTPNQPGGPSNSNSQSQLSNSTLLQFENFIQSILEGDKVDKILAPFSDHRWNTLKFLKIQKLFGNYTIEKMPNIDQKLHPEEIYLRAKFLASIYHKENESYNNLKSAIESLEKLSPKDQDEFKVYKADLLRKRAIHYWNNEKYLEATEDMQKSILTCDTYYKTWKSWLGICFSNYLKRKNSEYWVRNCMQLIPQALKYKSYKTQMIFSYAFLIMHQDQQFFIDNIKQIQSELPKPQMLMWLPNMLSIIQNTSTPEIIEVFTKIINDIAVYYPQHVFYYLRGLLDSSVTSQSVSQNTNTTTINNAQILKIYNNLRTCQNSALVKKLETFADLIAQQYFQSQPQFEFETLLNEINKLLEEFSSLNQNSNIPEFFKKIGHTLTEASQYSFFHKNIINTSDISAYISDLQNNKLNAQQVISILRFKIYTPMLKYFVQNYLEQQNPTGYFNSDQLLSLSQNVQEIELPGQYKIPQNANVFRDFDPSTHSTILSINKSLIIGLSKRKIQKQIVINASNNKQYIYEVFDAKQDGDKCNTFQQNQLKIFAIQQMQDIMNILFSLHKETNIRNMSIKNPQKFSIMMREQTQTSKVYKKNMQIMLVPRAPVLLTFQDIYDQFLSKDSKLDEDKLNIHLNNFNLDNQLEVNQNMKNVVDSSVLYDHIFNKVSDLNDFIYIRKEFTYNYSSAMFFNYFVGQSLKIEHIYLDISKGTVYTNTTNTEVNSNDKLILKNPHSIRISRNISNYINDIGILGIVAPTFISMAKAVTQPKYPLREVCMLFLNELSLAMDLKENVASDSFGEQLKRLYDKLLWLYVEDTERTWINMGQKLQQEQESNMQVENSEQENPVHSRTNNGFIDPIYPRAYTIIETLEQSQQNNNNNLIYKYWF
ncbi:hypothetical protein ABPG72_000520 [Tetrahymena utriculariae]